MQWMTSEIEILLIWHVFDVYMFQEKRRKKNVQIQTQHYSNWFKIYTDFSKAR